MSRIKPFLQQTFFVLLITGIFAQIIPQEVTVGADVVSRYVWRGLIINTTPNVQPSVAFSHGNFDAGVRGSYTFAESQALSEENDLSFGYTIRTENFGAFRSGLRL
ncbi:MAG: hypothetical protein KJ799_16760 [Bacteroidetes bacterium]|nr:hypothetical protein [Bacteroidota bacterium]